MTAKMARDLMKKQKKEKVVVQENITELQQKINYWNYSIEKEAENKKSYTQVSHPGDEMYKQLKDHFEKKGFYVHEYKEDAGYCIGDRWWVQINW